MEFSAGDIAVLLGGRVEGDPAVRVSTLAKIQEGHAGAIAFLSNLKYEQYLYETKASAVIVSEDLVLRQDVSCSLIRVKDAYIAFTLLLEQYQKMVIASTVGIEQPSYIDVTVTQEEGLYVGAFAYIGKGVKLGKNVKIHPQAFVGEGVTIGEGTVIGPGAKVLARCKIGQGCFIQAGAVIGSDGFGFAPQEDGSYKPIPQIGIVVIEDFVDVGANTTIDRATMGETRILSGAKIDNLVQVAHNVVIGSHTVVAAQAGIAGSTEIGTHCMIGGQVGIVGHIKIAPGTKIQAQSGIAAATREGQSYQGSPAMPIRDFLKSMVIFRKLPELESRLQEIEQQFRASSTD